MRKLLIVLILSNVFLSLKSQTWEAIKGNNEYLWGEGRGVTVADADRNALADLTSKITTHVSNSFDIVEEETTDGKKTDSKTYVKNRVNTYSQATLNNTEKILISNEPDAHIVRWIKREEIARIFKSREIKAKDLVESALRAEESGKVDDALRNYYWAFALLRSLQHPNEVTYKTEDGKSHVLLNWIRERMDAVFDDIDIYISKRVKDDVHLSIKYKNKPVTSIDYTYFDGRDWSNIYSAKDGIGVLELAKGNSNDNYQVKIEFEYRGESMIDKDVEAVLSVVNSIPMRKSYKNITAQQSQEKNDEKTVKVGNFSKLTANQMEQPKEISDIAEYDKTLRSILQSVISRRFDAPSTCFTANGLDVYSKLIKYGTAKVVGDVSPRYYNSSDGVVARGIKMSFSFKNCSRKAFVEDVIFYFDKAAKVSNITFGLGESAETDILYKGAWDENARKAIMEFLENYKTAYSLKRLDYIETVFDDDAVIIVANVASKATFSREGDGNLSMQNNQVIKHNRYTKDQYLRNLKRCFSSNEFINIRFANNDVIKLGKGGETYAIQISQDYYSSNYGDKGYLFLIVDINDINKPLIRLRTWQAEKDPNFGLYGPGDFK